MPQKPFNLCFLGGPGSGKGTQTGPIAKTFGIPHISTGDILRNLKSDLSNPLAPEVAKYMDAGQLMPNDLVEQLVAERLKLSDCESGFVLDGFPRTLGQAEFLSGITKIDYAILINVSDEAIIERMGGRRVCKNGHTYHVKYNPSKNSEICDVCGEPLYLRDDDNPETVKSRLEIYHRETDAILKFYKDQGVLLDVNGEQSIEDVYREVVRKIVGDLRNK